MELVVGFIFITWFLVVIIAFATDRHKQLTTKRETQEKEHQQ